MRVRRPSPALPTFLALALAGCGQSAAPTEPDPFAETADRTEGLSNVSADLDLVLERGALAGACDRYRGGASDRRSMLLCGKQMFFDESFGTLGLPAVLARFLVEELGDQVGPGFAKLGMIEDPRSPEHMPLGLAKAAPFAAGVDGLAFTCAACHFARLPDGRYAVGAPNHAYAYGRHILSMGLFPTLALLGKPEDHDPAAVAAVQPLVDRVNGDAALRDKLLQALIPLAASGAAMPSFSRETERAYASWSSGTMDFVMAPLPIDDQVHTISKIIGLWGIPEEQEAADAGMEHGLLAWTGSARSLSRFLHGFIVLGTGPIADWTDEKVRPLIEYIHSLRAPKSSSPPDGALAARGRELFREKGCIGCHGGPRGSGKRVYRFEEVGTDRAMERWLDPDLDGNPCCGIAFAPGEGLTHGIKSPRLAGAWALGRFLHNGSVARLEDLFCVGGPRGGIVEPAYGDGGHEFTCGGLAADEKAALIAYLKAN